MDQKLSKSKPWGVYYSGGVILYMVPGIVYCFLYVRVIFFYPSTSVRTYGCIIPGTSYEEVEKQASNAHGTRPDLLLLYW